MKKGKLFKTLSSLVLATTVANAVLPITADATVNIIDTDSISSKLLRGNDDFSQEYPAKTLEEIKNSEDGFYSDPTDPGFVYVKKTFEFEHENDKSARDYVFIFDNTHSTRLQKDLPEGYDTSLPQPADKILATYNAIVERMGPKDTITLVQTNSPGNISEIPSRKLNREEAKGALRLSTQAFRTLEYDYGIRINGYDDDSAYITSEEKNKYNTEDLFLKNKIIYNNGHYPNAEEVPKAVAIILTDELWALDEIDYYDDTFIAWVQESTTKQYVYSFVRDYLLEHSTVPEEKTRSKAHLDFLYGHFANGGTRIDEHDTDPAHSPEGIANTIMEESNEGDLIYTSDNNFHFSVTGPYDVDIESVRAKSVDGDFADVPNFTKAKNNISFEADRNKLDKIEVIAKINRKIFDIVFHNEGKREKSSTYLFNLIPDMPEDKTDRKISMDYTFTLTYDSETNPLFNETSSIRPFFLSGNKIEIEKPVPYDTERRANDSMYEDEPEKVVQEGVNGVEKVIGVRLNRPDGTVFYEGPLKEETIQKFGKIVLFDETFNSIRVPVKEKQNEIIEYGTKKREVTPAQPENTEEDANPTPTTPTPAPEVEVNTPTTPENEGGNVQPTPEITKPEQPTTETKVVTEVVPVDFEVTNVDDDTINVGESKVQTEGENGEKTITYEVVMENGKEISRIKVKEEITKQPTNKVVKVGTKKLPERTTENVVEKEPVPFKTVLEKDSTLPIGETKIATEGVNGEKDVTYVVVKEGDIVITKTKSFETVTKQPVNKVIKVGTKQPEVKVNEVPFKTVYLDEPTLEKGKTIVVVEGKNGTAKPDGTIITPPQDRVIKVGSKEPVVEKIKIPFDTILEKDPTLPKGEQKVVIEGVDGEKTADGKIIKQPVSKVIKIGTKENINTIIPFETDYIEDTKLEYGKRETVQEGITGEKDSNGNITKQPLKAIIKVGTKTSVTEEVLKSEVVYKQNKDLKPYEENVVQEGKDGLKTTTKTYELDTKTGEVKETVTVDEQPAVNKIVEVGKELAKIKELPSTGVSTTSVWVILATAITGVIATLGLMVKKRKN